MSDDRATFLALLYNQPLRRADAIVCLAGEDGMARAAVALQLFKQGAAPQIIVTGGLHDGKRLFGAEHLAGWLMGEGVAPDRIIVEDAAQDTRDQALASLEIFTDHDINTFLLVASAYHLPRAFLTFSHGVPLYCDIRQIIPVAATPPWCEAPPGADKARLELLADEFEKIARYGAHGDVASYADGIAYLTGTPYGQTKKIA